MRRPPFTQGPTSRRRGIAGLTAALLTGAALASAPASAAAPAGTRSPVGTVQAPGSAASERRAPFTLTTVTSALQEPTAVVTLADRRLIVLEQTGAVRIVTPAGHLLQKHALDIP